MEAGDPMDGSLSLLARECTFRPFPLLARECTFRPFPWESGWEAEPTPTPWSCPKVPTQAVVKT
jgi:hypothetical protein